MDNRKPFPEIGMSPSVWGPIVWTTMHIVSLGYSHSPNAEEKQAAIDFYQSLVHMIPCPICREHYKMFLAKYPVKDAVGNRNDLIYWVFMIHNKVNEQLGKPVLSMEQYIHKMTYLSNQHSLSLPSEVSLHSTYLLGAGILLGLGLVGLYTYNKLK